jgi:hypothetical protein
MTENGDWLDLRAEPKALSLSKGSEAVESCLSPFFPERRDS